MELTTDSASLASTISQIPSVPEYTLIFVSARRALSSLAARASAMAHAAGENFLAIASTAEKSLPAHSALTGIFNFSATSAA
jgi:hypothetical protein